ncbi:hypothetical protein D3C75_1182980 [compost metagenome]
MQVISQSCAESNVHIRRESDQLESHDAFSPRLRSSSLDALPSPASTAGSHAAPQAIVRSLPSPLRLTPAHIPTEHDATHKRVLYSTSSDPSQSTPK